MIQRIVFVDTSVLLNLVPVPGRDQDRDATVAEMAERMAQRHSFILPITAVIETGNFIAQIPEGGARREAAQKMENLLRLICDGKAPWILHDIEWNSDFLLAFLDGAGSRSSYVEHAMAKIGAGDLCILAERSRYASRTGIEAEIWTMDDGLRAYS